MKKVNLVLLIVVIVLVLLIAGWGIWKITSSSEYSAVYLSSGDLYFGKLVHFPNYGMKQVYTIQVNQQNQKNPLSVQKFSDVFWGPEDFLKINKEQVVWTAGLDSAGQMAQLLKQNPNLRRQQQQAPTGGAQQMPGTGGQVPAPQTGQ